MKTFLFDRTDLALTDPVAKYLNIDTLELWDFSDGSPKASSAVVTPHIDYTQNTDGQNFWYHEIPKLTRGRWFRLVVDAAAPSNTDKIIKGLSKYLKVKKNASGESYLEESNFPEMTI